MRKGALQGIKVVDFAREGVGPVTVRYLAHFGATVVRVESAKSPDGSRSVPPFKDGVAGMNRSAFQAKFNTNKYGIALDMNHPKAREFTTRLIKWTDIVAESYLPGQIAKWGLGYDDIKKIKPDIIMCSMTMQGQTGPHARHPGMGMHLASGSGLTNILGYPDEGPLQPYGAYTDWIAPRFAAAYILAALDYRRRTGKGQYIDLSQFEATAQFLAPLILNYSVNGREVERKGNWSPTACPHEVYRCKGDDRWCVIAVQTNEQWQNFCKVIGDPTWIKDPKFSTRLSRKKNEAELNQLVECWTIEHDAEDIQRSMQAAGVPAGVVMTSEDLFNDPQIRHRHHFWKVRHSEIGEHLCEGINFILSKTPGNIKTAGNCIGEHTEHVCTHILGMSDAEFITLHSEGLFV